MKVKKYVAPTMPEVMNQIRKELGPEAVILNSKQILSGGFLGLFKKKKIEVIAALDPDPLPSQSDKHTDAIPKSSKVIDLSPKIDSNSEVLNEIKHLKKIIEVQSIKNKENYQPDYQIAFQYLLEQELDRKYAEEIINTVVKCHQENGISSDFDRIMQDIGNEMNNKLSGLTFQGVTYDKKIVQFVGPTGVGKTTTIAKVAANSMLNDHKKVAFITSDTYRIAAIEQLKTYARILDIPLEVVYTVDDYKNAIKKFAAYDLILVDTAGRNFRDEKYVQELKKGIDMQLNTDIYLVLSLTAKPKDLTEIYDQFHHIPIKEVIFTKIDETRQYGSIVNIALDKQVGVAYLTNGQDVPDDLLQVTPSVICDLIVGGYGGE